MTRPLPALTRTMGADTSSTRPAESGAAADEVDRLGEDVHGGVVVGIGDQARRAGQHHRAARRRPRARPAVPTMQARRGQPMRPPRLLRMAPAAMVTAAVSLVIRRRRGRVMRPLVVMAPAACSDSAVPTCTPAPVAATAMLLPWISTGAPVLRRSAVADA
jgi:hypothetical protein